MMHEIINRVGYEFTKKTEWVMIALKEKKRKKFDICLHYGVSLPLLPRKFIKEIVGTRAYNMLSGGTDTINKYNLTWNGN